MSIEEKIKTAKEDSWLKGSVSEKEFKEIKDNERRMTREEAIEYLKRADTTVGKKIKTRTAEALEMAIRALKNEQTDGDLISRQAVIDLLNRFIEVEQKQGTDVMNYGRERVNAYESVLWEIESDYLFPSMPSAEKTDGDLITEIDKLPRIKVGNSNSQTVKYCIDERLLYEILEKMKGEAEREKVEQTYDWCKGCKEYDTEKHCCHRYSSFIRESLQDNINAVLEDIKAELKKYANHEVIAISGGEESGLDIAIGVLDKHISELKGGAE